MKTRTSLPIHRHFVGSVFLLVVFVVLAFPLTAETAGEKPAVTPPAMTAPADLKSALAALAKVANPADYAAALDAYSTMLSPLDAVALLKRSLESTGSEYREPLVIKAGDLALLIGLFGDAATQYEAAALLDPDATGKDRLLLRAARSFLASGDPEKASQISSCLVSASQAQDIVAAARLVGAWSLTLQGKIPEAQAAAAAVAETATTPPAARREARFILWLSASADKKPEVAAAIAADFPGSPEALIASGAVSPPPLPHWYLGGLTAALKAAVPTVAVPQAKVETSATATASASPTRAKRLQVGYFTVEENARVLKEELTSKRFDASIEVRSRAPGSGKAEEKRWIVVVEGGKDIAKSMLALKDAGYESYVID